MWQYIVTFIGSLVVAWFSVRWSARMRDKRALTSLGNEISTNLELCKVVCDNLHKDVESLKEGKTSVTPLAQLHTWAWNVTASAISLSDEDASRALEVAYTTTDITNNHVQRIEELKHGVIPILVGEKAWPKIEANCAALKKYIEERTIVALQDAKVVLDKELSKYRWWHF